MIGTPFFMTQIKGTMDVALARINLRKQLLAEIQCDMRTIARSIVALTALGELIMSTRSNSTVPLNFSIGKTENNKMVLQFNCDFKGDFLSDPLFNRYLHNLGIVTDGVTTTSDNGRTKVHGFIHISYP